MLRVSELLKYGADKLEHIESGNLDIEVILSHVIDKPREYILAHPEHQVSENEAERFKILISERATHKPVAYLTHHKEFYGRDFYVDERVHIPRPATEDLIDYIKEFVPPDFSGTMADIGTGSGCIAITLALEYPQTKIIATDISTDALEVAKQNALKHGNRAEDKITFLHGNLLEPLTKPVDIVISNPPYGWMEGWSDDPEVEHQPKISYNGGTDGLDIIRQLLQTLPDYLKKDGQAFLKFDPRRVENIKSLIQESGFRYSIKKDLAGFDRIARVYL